MERDLGNVRVENVRHRLCVKEIEKWSHIYKSSPLQFNNDSIKKVCFKSCSEAKIQLMFIQAIQKKILHIYLNLMFIKIL